MSTREQGAKGEEQAREYLEGKGYILHVQNFCIPGGEIDLIMTDGETLVFIEVKKRQQGFFGTPEESITPQKLRFLRRSAMAYMQKKNISIYDTDMRMDLVAIEKQRSGNDEIRHYKNAFYFDDF